MFSPMQRSWMKELSNNIEKGLLKQFRKKGKQTIIDSLHFPLSVGTDDHFCGIIVVMVDLDCTKFTLGAMLAQDFCNLHSISIKQHCR